jgi:hypothetical protein
MKMAIAGIPKTKMARSSVFAHSGSTSILFPEENSLARHPTPRPQASQREEGRAKTRQTSLLRPALAPMRGKTGEGYIREPARDRRDLMTLEIPFSSYFQGQLLGSD